MQKNMQKGDFDQNLLCNKRNEGKETLSNNLSSGRLKLRNT